MRRTAAVLALLLVGLGAAGCSDDGDSCSGSTYHPDLDQQGSASPIDALDAWFGTDAELPDPPDDGWVVQDSGAKDPATVVILNEGEQDEWWVSVARTSSGGWVVEQATPDAAGCSDLPSA
ncbi:hypothetical protein [Nocardioides mangrovi]|uniref:Lipoprotein n=1 Tax=Nocardioides mangrovi TaxID=2874580 RepID=A0ABS7UDA6_9ACTN|nr:hypothetical protein [Nocardioides mangrovi]MBZ5738983.1 hypothetical protein [Nocardioides mangrovi]